MRKFQKISHNSPACELECCYISSAGSRALRCLLFFFNVIFICTGIALGCSTVLILINHGGSVLDVLMHQERVPLYVVIVWLSLATTVLILLNGILVGNLAVKIQNRGILILYCVNLVLVSMSEILIGMFSYVHYNQVESELQTHLKFNPEFYSNDSIGLDHIQNSVDEIQREMECCGARTYGEYSAKDGVFSEATIAEGNFSVPDSCCKSEAAGCGAKIHPSNIYYTGCAHPIALEIQYHLLIQGALGLSMCVIQMFGFCYSFILICVKRRRASDDEEGF